MIKITLLVFGLLSLPVLAHDHDGHRGCQSHHWGHHHDHQNDDGDCDGDGSEGEGGYGDEGEGQGHCEGEGCAEGEGSYEGEGSAEGEGQSPCEGEGSGSEGEGSVGEGEGAASEGEGTPCEGEGDGGDEGEGGVAEGEGSAEGEGVDCAEGEGSGDEGEGAEGEGGTVDRPGPIHTHSHPHLAGSSVFNCAFVPASGFLMFAVLGCLLFFRRKSLPLMIIGGVFLASQAKAEGISAFEVAAPNTFLTTPTAQTLDKDEYTLYVAGQWAQNPLVFRDDFGRPVANVLNNLTELNLGGAVGLGEQVEAGFTVGAQALQGPVFNDNVVYSASDPSLYAKWMVWTDDHNTLALRGDIDAPGHLFSTVRQNLSGDVIPTITPSVVLTTNFGPAAVGFSAGHTFRWISKPLPNGEVLGSSFNLGVGATAKVLDNLDAVADLNSALYYSNTQSPIGSSRVSLPTDLNGGLRFKVGDFAITGGVGTGLVADVGSPHIRVFGLLAYNGSAAAVHQEITPPAPAPCPTPNVEKPYVPPAQPAPVLAKIVGNQIIILQPVHFAFDKDVVLNESLPVLNDVALIMKQHPELKLVEVDGHTDSIGSDAYNDKLSGRRVASVIKYLISVGVESGRLEGYGFGKRQPIVSNQTTAGRATNRRVEFKILMTTDK